MRVSCVSEILGLNGMAKHVTVTFHRKGMHTTIALFNPIHEVYSDKIHWLSI